MGGNQNKRVSEEFEIETVNRLIKDSTLILDKGATDEEREQINRVIAALRPRAALSLKSPRATTPTRLRLKRSKPTRSRGTAVSAPSPGLIAAGDRYVGYDSAGQHIAAALRIPADGLRQHKLADLRRTLAALRPRDHRSPQCRIRKRIAMKSAHCAGYMRRTFR